ncbi:MAG: hypothetical protein RSP_22790 [Rhodanobacter sp.]
MQISSLISRMKRFLITAPKHSHISTNARTFGSGNNAIALRTGPRIQSVTGLPSNDHKHHIRMVGHYIG